MFELFVWSLFCFGLALVGGAFGLRDLFAKHTWWWPAVTLILVSVACSSIAGISSLFTSQIVEMNQNGEVMSVMGYVFAIRTLGILAGLSLISYGILRVKRPDRFNTHNSAGELHLVGDEKKKTEGASI